MKKRISVKVIGSLFAAGALFSSFTAPAQAALNPADTSVQMFRWKWNDIMKECTNHLGPQGYGAVQVSPPQASNSVGTWWDVYQPVNFTSLNSRMGTEAEFQTMINTCHAVGVRIYVDAVVNHMSAGSGTATNGNTWNSTTLTYPNFSGPDFHNACDIQGSDYGSPGNRNNVMNCRLVGLPDLKTESTYVQGQIRNYFNKLVAMGADGIRIDAAKHIQPSHITAILNGTNRTTTSGEALWITQEVIPDSNAVRADYFPERYAQRIPVHVCDEVGLPQRGQQHLADPHDHGHAGQLGRQLGLCCKRQGHRLRQQLGHRTQRQFAGGQRLHCLSHANDTQGTKRYDLANIFMLAWPYGHAQLHSGYRFQRRRPGPAKREPLRRERQSADQPVVGLHPPLVRHLEHGQVPLNRGGHRRRQLRAGQRQPDRFRARQQGLPGAQQ
ncbi:hypothetical protein LP419_21665 [Massilia sp. H-1]|nr:hypothetical protein LP419_21665 [Massilia sp. H-1]